MIIDCHGHYTTAPQALTDFRDAQKAALKDPAPERLRTLIDTLIAVKRRRAADDPELFAAYRTLAADAQSVVVQALQALADAGQIDRSKVEEAFAKYRIDDPTAVAGVKQEGGDA